MNRQCFPESSPSSTFCRCFRNSVPSEVVPRVKALINMDSTHRPQLIRVYDLFLAICVLGTKIIWRDLFRRRSRVEINTVQKKSGPPDSTRRHMNVRVQLRIVRAPLFASAMLRQFSWKTCYWNVRPKS